MGGRGKADRQAPRFAHREDEGVVVGSQQSDEKEEGVKKAPCACRWELLSPLSTHGSCISYMTDSVYDRPTYSKNYKSTSGIAHAQTHQNERRPSLTATYGVRLRG